MPDLDQDELAVIAHAAAGLTLEEIAAALGGSTRTVRRRLVSAAEKLGTRGMTHTVAVAAARGLVSPEIPPAPTTITDRSRIRSRPVASKRRPSQTVTAALPAICAALPGLYGILPLACDAAGIKFQTVLMRQKDDPDLRRTLLDAGWVPRRQVRLAAAFDTVLARVAEGATIKQALKDAGISYPTWRGHLREDARLRERYGEAREAGREYRGPSLARDDLLAAVEGGLSLKQYAEHLDISSSRLHQQINGVSGLREEISQVRAARSRERPPGIEPFLAALRQSGSMRAAAAGVGVSQWSVTDWRSRFPDFGAEVQRILAERRRNPPWLAPLLAALEEGATFLAACEKADVFFTTAYRARREQPEIDTAVRAAVERGRARSGGDRWRHGARDTQARREHNKQTRGHRRGKTLARFTPEIERIVLEALGGGTPLDEAAAQVGMKQQTLFGRARFDRGWAARLDSALMAGRDPGIRHGTDYVYKVKGCRCPECREAHARFRS